MKSYTICRLSIRVYEIYLDTELTPALNGAYSSVLSLVQLDISILKYFMCCQWRIANKHNYIKMLSNVEMSTLYTLSRVGYNVNCWHLIKTQALFIYLQI